VLAAAIRRLLRFRLWLAGLLRAGELPSILFWAGLIGFLGALISVAFRDCITLLQNPLAGEDNDLYLAASRLSPWIKLLLPVAGGACAGLILQWGIHLGKNRPSGDYMEAVVVGDGVIPFRTTLVKSISSLCSIASGGSIGREGPMVQLSAMLASVLGRKQKVSAPRLRLYVACGAAAGIASAYNAPIAGALFVSEIVLGSIAVESFGPLAFSSVMATVTVHQLMGAKPTYTVPHFQVVSNWEFVFYVLLGVLTGLVAPIFIRLLREGEEIFRRLNLPLALKLALGGLVVGVLALQRPEVYGNGYTVVNSILWQDWPWAVLLAVLCSKLLATSATAGSGAVGGLFTPTLFVGAVSGCLLGKILHVFQPDFTAGPGAYALIGMGGFLAATTQAPLMAILMIFEMTLEYSVVLPLMLTCVTAHMVAKSLGQESIYAHHLRQRDFTRILLPVLNSKVGDLIKPNEASISPITPFGQIAEIFAQHRINYLYVTDEANRFLGVVSLHDLKPHLNSPELSDAIIALDILKEDFPFLTPDQHVTEALRLFSLHDGERIPVLNSKTDRKLLGTVSKLDLLLRISEIKAGADPVPA